jgi:hypothetical protein
MQGIFASYQEGARITMFIILSQINKKTGNIS